MKYILLTKGKRTLVDDEDYEYLKQWKWYFGSRYAQRQEYLGKINGKYQQKTVYMHRELCSSDEDVDHINGDTLDNRRSNLRACTHQQNSYNQKLRKSNTSGYKGVSWHKQRKKWVVQLQYNGKKLHLGLFTDIEDAVKAYNDKSILVYGDFARKEV